MVLTSSQLDFQGAFHSSELPLTHGEHKKKWISKMKKEAFGVHLLREYMLKEFLSVGINGVFVFCFKKVHHVPHN